jgi:hypothetical protein
MSRVRIGKGVGGGGREDYIAAGGALIRQEIKRIEEGNKSEGKRSLADSTAGG